MKILVRLILLCSLVALQSCVVNQIGGAFDYEPEALQTGLSAEAKIFLNEALHELQSEALQDYHAHILGLGSSGSGMTVNADMTSGWHLLKRLKFKVYLSASGITDRDQSDAQYLDRFKRLIKHSPITGKYSILAFDYHYIANGEVDEKNSEIYIPNQYVIDIAAQNPDIFRPVISVHPYRKDALQELEVWAKKGVRMVKWLPNAQGIDPADARLDDYYRVMQKHKMILLSHVGKEQAVDAENFQELGNPLRFRRALDLGVTVIMAHSASLGKSKDLDNNNVLVDNFDLFLRMMDDSRYVGNLYGEISAITQMNRLPHPLSILLKRTDLHSRLINGSDYPLPAVNIVISTNVLVKYGFITRKERQYLNEIYDYNPLLFDLVVKRVIKHPETGEKFPAQVFTRDIFAELEKF